ncbi:hypothetical protein PISMIDRAFT_6663 [Pisolithus microcarpus 441]|uniref:Unplaced genomic scaffold scaffold_4, whole genome shotgun sequence n=1 Tax=Pisolithus microcarpus 441 TaxID=765257 RepID=A0A0C9ZVC7_9AGAM|nr:hypothetical protein PISMIDRAFT_6663 [Pisolithus microcarpus 441]
MSSTPNKLARSRLLPGWFGKKANRVHEAVRPGSTNSGDVQMAESIRSTTVVLQWLSDPREVLVVEVAETNPVRCVSTVPQTVHLESDSDRFGQGDARTFELLWDHRPRVSGCGLRYSWCRVPDGTSQFMTVA